MKFLLTAFLLYVLTKISFAQTVVGSMQTTNNDKIFAMDIVGKRDGHSFHHTIHFDVTGMSQTQRDSLYQETLRALGILGITDVPGLKKSDSKAESKGNVVRFSCETCTDKGRLEVYGNGITSTRIIDSRQDGDHSFPLTLTLDPGDYRLMYYQKRVLQIQSTFTVKVGEENVVKVK